MNEFTGKEEAVQTAITEVKFTEDEYLFFLPPSVPVSALPIFDDELGQVIGFRWVDPSVDEEYAEYAPYRIYDLEGQVVEEQMIFDPPIQPSYLLEDLILLVTGAGAALKALRSGGGLAVRSIGNNLSRGLVYGVSAAVISRSAYAGLRMAFRVLTTRQIFKFTSTAAAQMARTGRQVPTQILFLAVKHGRRAPDPRGVPGLFMYTIPIRTVRNGKSKQRTLEVLIRETDFTIFHFLYK